MAVILVIDDSSVSRKMVENQLSKTNHTVLTSSDWIQGTILLHQKKVDLLMVDVNMPGLQGPQGLELLKGDKKIQLPTIVFFSSMEEEPLCRLSQANQVDGYIQKQKDLSTLPQVIDAFLRKKNPETPS